MMSVTLTACDDDDAPYEGGSSTNLYVDTCINTVTQNGDVVEQTNLFTYNFK